MSVDDRLRAGLRSNAAVFAPEGEQRLEEVGRRHRRRTAVRTIVAAALVLAIGGTAWWTLLGGAPAGTHAIDPVRTPPSRQLERPVVPDSSWTKVITREQAVAVGADRAFVRENFGRADRVPYVLSFIGDVYSVSARYPQGWSVGDAGTLAYDEQARLVTRSTSPGCRGCTATIEWAMSADGERLRLSGMTGDVTSIDRLVFEGVWARQDS